MLRILKYPYKVKQEGTTPGEAICMAKVEWYICVKNCECYGKGLLAYKNKPRLKSKISFISILHFERKFTPGYGFLNPNIGRNPVDQYLFVCPITSKVYI